MWLLALLQLAWLGWLLAFPVALDSDDALNFAHGVVRFSVLEFSPHFPGYPAFIWLATGRMPLTRPLWKPLCNPDSRPLRRL